MTSKGPERSLTIHHVAPHFYPEIGGLEDSVRRFSAWLVERGHHVVVHTSALTISGERLAPRDSIDGIEIRRYEPIARRGYYRTLFRPDLSAAQLIHLHGYAVRTNDRVVREYRDRRLAFSLHHGVRMPAVDARTRVLRRGYDALVGLRTLRRVGRIVVPSVADRDWLAHHRVPADRVSILPTPLPKEAFDAGNSSWASAQTGGAPFVLYLGRLHQEKGVDDLLETVPHLPASIRLMYAGPDGGRLEALRNRARELRVEDRVRFLGVVSEGADIGLCDPVPRESRQHGLTHFHSIRLLGQRETGSDHSVGIGLDRRIGEQFVGDPWVRRGDRGPLGHRLDEGNGLAFMEGRKTHQVRGRVDRWPLLANPSQEPDSGLDVTRSNPLPQRGEIRSLTRDEEHQVGLGRHEIDEPMDSFRLLDSADV